MTNLPPVAPPAVAPPAVADAFSIGPWADALPHLLWTTFADGTPAAFNARWQSYTGLAPQQVRARGWEVILRDLLHPDDADAFVAAWRNAVAARATFEAEGRLRRAADGVYHWFLACAVPTPGPVPAPGEGAAPGGWVGTWTDIDRQKAAAAKTSDLEQFLNSIVENIPDMIFVKDAAELRFIKVNRGEEILLGRPRGELVGKNDYDLFPKEEADFFIAVDRRVLSGGDIVDIPEEPIHTRFGRKYLHTRKIPVLDAEGRPRYLLGISRDITARKEAEEQLREKNRLLEEAVASERAAHAALKAAQGQLVQAEKLAALGQLVAGVAHEINNPLAFVTNNVVVLQRDLAELHTLLAMYRSAEPHMAAADPALVASVRELAERIDLDYTMENLPELLNRSRDGLKRIQQIVRDLREFSRQEAVGEWQEGVDLNAGVQSTLNIIKGRARKQQVDFEMDLAPLPGILCYPAKLNQVVLNLVANAIDACPPGGKVTVRSRPVGEGGRDGVELSVCDTGSGIAPDIRGRIFDPFFTTKPQGKGTGLGLSISHGIVADHGGTIAVDSEVGRGTCFTIRLPRVPPEASRPAGVR